MKLKVVLKRSDFKKHKPKSKPRVVFAQVRIDALHVRGDIRMFTMTDSQKASLTINPVDKRGNPARVDGIPVWASSDETKVTVAPAADGLSCDVVAAGALGQCQVTVSADADLGPGVATINGVLDITIVGGQAVGLAIAAAAPIEQ
jgi:hypothetical protein